MIETLKTRMRNEVVEFTFMKVDGTERKAKGTTALDVLEANNAVPAGNAVPDSTTRFFDIEKNAWRSFRSENLISIDN